MHGRTPHGRFARLVTWLAVTLRWPILIGWTVAAVAAWMLLPALGSGGASPLGDIVPENAEAIRTEERAFKLFGSAVATDTVVVQRNPRGLQRSELAGHLRGARSVSSRQLPPDLQGVRAALPLVNAPVGGLPWRERGTTALTYMFFTDDLNLVEREEAVSRYQDRFLQPAPGSVVGTTGAGPARLSQFEVLEDKLPLIEGATVAVIVLIVALYFRSLGAPIVALFVAALSYVLAVRGLAWAGERMGASVPQEIEPILVVLLLGLVTDYSVFFLSEGRRRLLRGEERLEAARRASVRIMPIVFTAGVIVAAGTASLLAGQLEFFRVFGPGLAVCAIVVTLVCVTLLPAILGIAGPWLFGKRVRQAEPPPPAGRPAAIPVAGPGQDAGGRFSHRFAGFLGAMRAGRRHAKSEGGSRFGAAMARILAARPVSALLALVCIAALVLAALQVRGTGLSASFVGGLPESSEPRRAGDDAVRGFVPGILAPTDVVLEGQGITRATAGLDRLQAELAKRPGVAAVVGPREARASLRTERFALAQSGNAARLVVVLGDEAGSAKAIRTLNALEDDLPAALRRAGLPAGTRTSLGGETALAAETVDAIKSDLKRIALATVVVTFLLLALFLRALVAPLVLLAASILGFAAALGISALIIPGWLGGSEITYYVPLVAAVLLVALGSDYNVFIAGRIREEATRRRLREAIAVAAPSASRAITVAGITLAATFALLAIVPIRAFRELALLMAIGVLLDALLVRPVLIPSLISVVGRFSWWPGKAQSPVPADVFLSRVGERIGLGTGEARRVTHATFYTLGERLTNRQARELADQLPEKVREALTAHDGCETFGYDEFVHRVAARQGTSAITAREDAGAVMATVADLVPQTELDYVRASLTPDYRPLLGDATHAAAPIPEDGRPAAVAVRP